MIWARGFIAFVAGAGLVYLVWWSARHPEISLLGAFFAAQLPSTAAVLFIAFRSRWLSNNSIPLPVAVKANGLALAGTLLIPARLSELGKPLYINAMTGFPIARGMVIVIEERIWDFAVLALLAALALLLAGNDIDNSALKLATLVLAGIATTGGLALVVAPKLVMRLPYLSRLQEKHDVFKDWRLTGLAGAFMITVAAWAFSTATFWVAYAFSGLPTLSAAQVIVLFVATTLGWVISITPGGVGTYEGATVAVLVAFGVDWTAALAFSVAFRFCWLTIPLAAAFVAIWFDGDVLRSVSSKGGAGS